MEFEVKKLAPIEAFITSERGICNSDDIGASSDSDDDDAENPYPFLCEICATGSDTSAVFKERRELDVHILKLHSTACIGCFDVFDSKEMLLEHLEIEKHERPSYCRQCCGVFLDDAEMESHNCEGKSSAIEENPVSIKEECVSSDDDEEDKTAPSVNAFLCEICYSADNDSHAVFKLRSDLVLHTFKTHPSTCIGCFESFHTSDDLSRHVMRESHELPLCRECRRLFPDNDRLTCHHCQPTSIEVEEFDEVPVKMECLSEDGGSGVEELFVKMEPQSENEGSDYVYSSEQESNYGSESDQLQKGELSCIHCVAEGFQNQHSLRVHTNKAHSTVCVVCFEGFDDEVSLQKHQKALNHEVWTCVRCDKLFVKRRVYRQHVTAFHPEDCPYKCPHCDLKGFNEYFILKHRKRVHNDTTVDAKTVSHPNGVKLDWHLFPNMCNICLKSFMTSYSWLLHMFREHNKPGLTHVYKCELCQLGFGRGRVFEVHLKEDHAADTEYLNEVKTLLESTLRKSLVCDACGIPWPTTGRLQRHIKNKHPQLRPHKCNICGAGFPDEGDVAVHFSGDHGGPADYFACPLCSYRSGQAISLERHLKKSHGYQGMPHVYCFTHKKAFYEYKMYRKHFEIHHMDPADRPQRPPLPRTGFPCGLCEKEFGSIGRVNAHIAKVHRYSGERCKCDECGKSFKDINGLNNHKVKHVGTFKCKICHKSFELQSHVERHQVVHSGEKPFECELCGLKVSQKSSLQRHVKVVHANGKPSKTINPRKTRGPKGEGRMNRKIDENLTNGKVEENCTKGRKRRKLSKSGSFSEEEYVPKRSRGQPGDEINVSDKHRLNDDSNTKPRKRGRPRKARGEGEIRRQKQTDEDDFYLDGAEAIKVVEGDDQANEVEESFKSDEEWQASNGGASSDDEELLSDND